MRFVLLLLFFLAIIQAEAKESSIHVICKEDFAQCLMQLDDEYKKTTEYSHLWYNLKLYEIEAYFQLKSVEDRIALIQPLLKLKRAPYTFKVSAYIDYAKSHYATGDYETARKYSELALNMLTQEANAFENPIKLVQLINLKNYLISLDLKEGVISDPTPQYERSYDFLSRLAKGYERTSDYYLALEIHANLGVIAHHLGQYEQAALHYLDAAEWGKQGRNHQQTGVAYYNVGRMYQKMEAYSKGLGAFEESLYFYQRANDKGGIALSQLRLVELLFATNNEQKAQSLFKSVEAKDLLDFQYPLYEKVKQRCTC